MPPPSQRSVLLRAALVVAVTLVPLSAAAAVTLRGSTASLDRQNRQARLHGFDFYETSREIQRAVEHGDLVPVPGNGDYYLKEVSFPYARPEVRLFLERLSARYVEQCAEPLVVTSLTRSRRRQPSNASLRSVHPAGMGIDLRRSWSRRCRAWLEGVLLTLEDAGVLDATIEYRPVHYHLALFPGPYRDHLARLGADESEFRALRYQVTRGDTLARIARRHRTTVEQVKRSNGLRGDLIRPGQVLLVPASR